MTDPLRLIVWPGMPDGEGLVRAGDRIGRELDVSVVSSNEDLEHLLESDGPFDLICPSDYLVEKLAAEGRLADISDGFEFNREVLVEWSRNPSYDPDERFSVPLAYGTTGFLYDAELAPEHESWADFFEPAGIDVGVLGEVREVVGAALILAGHSPNATDEASLADASVILERQRPFVKSLTSDDFTGPVESRLVAIHQAWSGPAAMAMRNATGLGYTVPREGALLWVTTAAVTADAPDPDAARLLLKELMDPEIAALAVSNGGYSTPNCDARDLLPEDLRNDEVLFPKPETIGRCLTLTSLTPAEEKALQLVWEPFRDAQANGDPERAVDSRT